MRFFFSFFLGDIPRNPLNWLCKLKFKTVSSRSGFKHFFFPIENKPKGIFTHACLQVWKYFGTEKIGDSALERIHVDVQTLEGQTKTDVLLTGGINGSLRFVYSS